MSTKVIDTIKPAGTFHVAEAHDIDVAGKRLDVVIEELEAETGGTKNYNDLENQPKINGITLTGNKSTADLGINIPTKTSQLQNDSNFLTEHQSLEDYAKKSEVPNVPQWALNPSKPVYTKSEIGLSNVDNTSDADKPVSRLTQEALNIKANNVDVETLSARMNTFTNLPDGSTSGDAELQDARIGADGKTYTNAGTAIREQLKPLADVSTVNEVVFETEGYINNKGTISTEGGKWSGYIPIKSGTSIKGYARGLNGNLAIYAFYDKNKAFLSAFYGTNDYAEYAVDAPEEAAYVGFSKWTSAAFDDLKAYVKWNAYDYAKRNISALTNSTELYKSIVNDQSEVIIEHTYDGSSKGYTCEYIAAQNCTYEVQVIEAENDNVSTWVVGEQEKSVNIIKGKPVKITAGVEGAFRFYDTKAAAGTKLKMSIRPVFVHGDEVYYAGYTIKGYVNSYGEVSDETGHRSEYIPVHGGETIVCHGMGYNNNIALYAFFDENKNPVPGAYYGTNDYEDIVAYVPTNASYVVFSKLDRMTEQKAEMHWNSLMYADQKGRECGSTIDFYVGYGDDGTAHFSNLYRCFEVVSKTQGKKKIYIKGGTYDLLAQMGGMDYITSQENKGLNWRDVQPVMSDVEIVGVGNVVINFLLENRTVTDNPQLFSAINIRGNSRIENIEIHSCRCRYSIHDESGDVYPNTTRYYKNVRCYHNVDVDLMGQPQAIGCGFSDGTTVNMENCIISGKYEVWSCHANEGTVLNFNNCVFITSQSENSKGLRISQNGQKNIKATLANCYISHGLSIRNEWTEPTVTDVTDITLINTKCEQIYNNYEVIEKPIVSYNTLEGTRTVLLETNA